MIDENHDLAARAALLEKQLDHAQQRALVAEAAWEQLERSKHAQKLLAAAPGTASTVLPSRTQALTPCQNALHCAQLGPQRSGSHSCAITPEKLPLPQQYAQPLSAKQSRTIQQANPSGASSFRAEASHLERTQVRALELAAQHLNELHTKELAVSNRRYAESQVSSLCIASHWHGLCARHIRCTVLAVGCEHRHPKQSHDQISHSTGPLLVLYCLTPLLDTNQRLCLCRPLSAQPRTSSAAPARAPALLRRQLLICKL